MKDGIKVQKRRETQKRKKKKKKSNNRDKYREHKYAHLESVPAKCFPDFIDQTNRRATFLL